MRDKETATIEQRSDAWFRARCGSIGASQISDLMAKTKNGYGASRANLMAQLIAEKLTGNPTESYTTAAMQRGVDLELEARLVYEFMTNNDVVLVGLVTHPSIKGAHASPDGLVDPDGLVEIKIPNTATHIDYLLGDGIPDKYMKQMQFQMACTGRKWCDYVSYDPRMPPELQIKIERVSRDDDMIGEINDAIKVFISEMAIKIQKLKDLS